MTLTDKTTKNTSILFNLIGLFFNDFTERICEYFGVKIAMYFAYLGHYTKALMLPAFLGLFLLNFKGTSQVLSIFDIFSIFFFKWK